MEYDPNTEPIGNLFGVLMCNWPFQEIVWYAMIFGFLSAAEVVMNPFGNPTMSAWGHENDYCLDMFKDFEVEVWKASESIAAQHMVPINKE